MIHFKTVARPNYKEISHGVLTSGYDWQIVRYNDGKYYLNIRYDNEDGWFDVFHSYHFDDVITYRELLNERGW